MSSPYSKELDDLMSTLVTHLDSKLGSAAPSLDKPPGAQGGSRFAFPFQLSEKYSKVILPGYAVMALAAAFALVRHRAPRTTSGEPQMSLPKVLMWWVVMCIPLVVFVVYRPSAKK